MWRRRLIAGLVFVLSLPAIAQRHGGGMGGQGGPPAAGQQRGGAQISGERTRDRDRDRLRIHATDQQRDQYRTCTQAAERVRTQSRDMRRQAGAKSFDPVQARRQQVRLREQVRLMDQEHERLMQSLGGEQRAAAQKRVADMNQIRGQMRTHMEAIEAELDKPDPDGKRLSRQAGQMETAMNQWREQHRAMASEIGMEP